MQSEKTTRIIPVRLLRVIESRPYLTSITHKNSLAMMQMRMTNELPEDDENFTVAIFTEERLRIKKLGPFPTLISTV